jgi:hypothetical protein
MIIFKQQSNYNSKCGIILVSTTIAKLKNPSHTGNLSAGNLKKIVSSGE